LLWPELEPSRARAGLRRNLSVLKKALGGEWFPDRMSEGTSHLWMVGWWADYPDPDDYLRVVRWLPPGWQHEAYDRLVEGARRAIDQEERIRMYQQADRTLIEETPVLPLAYLRFHTLVKPWVRKYLTSPLRW